MANLAISLVEPLFPHDGVCYSVRQPKWVKALQKLLMQLSIVGHLLRVYLLKGVDAEALLGTVR